MRSSRKNQPEEEQSLPEMESGGLVYRTLVTLAILLLIAYVASLFIARTDGFRIMVEERLQERWQWPVQVGSARLTLGLNLEVRDVQSEGIADRNRASLRLNRVRWDWQLWSAIHPRRTSVVRWEIDGGMFIFQPDENGVMQPAHFSGIAQRLGAWANVLPLALREQAIGPPGVAIDWRNLDFYWLQASGTSGGALQGLKFTATEVTLPGRHLLHQVLSIHEVTQPNGQHTSDYALEWFLLDNTYVWVPEWDKP